MHIPPTSTHPPPPIPGSIACTPLWDSSESTRVPNETSPAWDPSSRSPRTDAIDRPSHWLDDPILQSSRLKLKTDDSTVQSSHVKFVGVEHNFIKVRDKMDFRLLGIDSVHPLLPTSPGDLVIANGGEMHGVHFNVIQIRGNTCVVRKPGCRPTKKKPDPEFLTSDLIQVYPVPRHR